MGYARVRKFHGEMANGSPTVRTNQNSQRTDASKSEHQCTQNFLNILNTFKLIKCF